MTTNATPQQEIDVKGLSLEYTTLREEIVMRIELRQQLIAVTLTLAGIFISVGLAFESVILVYPILALFLALGWFQNDFRIADTAAYIREYIEPLIAGLNYETWNQGRRVKNRRTATWRFVVLSHGGVFLVTQLLAISIGLVQFNRSVPNIILMTADIIAIVIVIWLLTRSRRV